jgi:transposase-like protein
MAKKARKKFTEEEKRELVADYVSGARTAQAIANELGTDIKAIYRWRTFYDEQRKDLRLSEL